MVTEPSTKQHGESYKLLHVLSVQDENPIDSMRPSCKTQGQDFTASFKYINLPCCVPVIWDWQFICLSSAISIFDIVMSC